MRAGDQVILEWRGDAVRFVETNFRPASIDPWQLEGLKAISNPKTERIAFKSCKGPGKTCFLAWVLWWFLGTRPGAKVFATSITGKNLRDGLWSETAKWLARSDEVAGGTGHLSGAFEWSTQRIVNRKNPGSWYASARTWEKQASDSDQSASMAGIHDDYTLVILDEVSGIPGGVLATAEGSLSTGVENKIVVAGNPLYLKGPLWDICHREAKLWKIFTITGDPDNPNRSPRVKIEYARQQIEKWGRNHPYVIVNIFGEFPPTSVDALLGPVEIEEAMQRQIEPSAFRTAQKRLGMDVAAYGDDPNILCRRQGLKVWPFEEQRNIDTAAKVNWVLTHIKDFGAEIEFIDGTGGFGTGTYDELLRAGHAGSGAVNPVLVHFNSRSSEREFFNKRSEMWWQAAQWVKRGGGLPNDPELAEELQATYHMDGDKIRIEEKELMKQRLGRSPNKADAFILTFAYPEMSASAESLLLGGNSSLPEYLTARLAEKEREDQDYDPWDRAMKEDF